MHTNHCKKPSKLHLPDCDTLAKDSLFVQRTSSKLSPSLFVTTLIQCVISGKTTLRKIAQKMNAYLPGMTRQALQQRFTVKSTKFLSGVLHDIMEQKFSSVRQALLKVDLSRIIVEDSTNLVMNKQNAETFPAHGNSYGATAGVKIDLAYDLLSGQCVSHTIEKATESDKSIGVETLDQVRPNDLVLRDMGYFIIESFKEIERIGAHWLSRLPMTCNACNLQGDSIESVLKKSKKNVVDIPVLLGDKEQHRCRLIAIRTDENVKIERQKNRKEKAVNSGKTPSAEGLIRDAWHLMVTSLTPEQASAEQLSVLYSARWGIELQFRGLKKEMNLRMALGNKTSEHHQTALILAAMIAHQLTLKYWNIYAPQVMNQGRAPSLEKIISNVISYLEGMKSLSDLELYDPDLRYLMYDKRSRASALVNQAFIALA